MYGGAASQATNEYLVSIGEATVGNLLPDGTYRLRSKTLAHNTKLIKKYIID